MSEDMMTLDDWWTHVVAQRRALDAYYDQRISYLRRAMGQVAEERRARRRRNRARLYVMLGVLVLVIVGALL